MMGKPMAARTNRIGVADRQQDDHAVAWLASLAVLALSLLAVLT
jgi:hypothetical protein